MNPQSRCDWHYYRLGERKLLQLLRDYSTMRHWGSLPAYSDAIAPLLAEIRAQTKFSGQVLAGICGRGRFVCRPLLSAKANFLSILLGAERRVRPFIERARKHVELTLALASSSVERVRSLIP